MRKSVAFTYTAYTNTYYDSLHQVPVGSPTQQYQNSTNWDYLTSYIDYNTGIGEKNITYATAYSNSDGTPTIKVGSSITDDRYDALYCSSNANNSDTSLRCFQGNYPHPNDQAWSMQVVTQISSSGQDSSSLSAATTTYNYYRLAKTGNYVSGAWCHPDQYSQEQDCVGDNWFANNDSDWQDYYHAEFRGFNQVWHLSPAGDLTVDYYFSTKGWNQPADDPADYNGGQLLEEDRYQGGSYSSSALLQKMVNTYPGPYPNTTPSNSTSNPSACYKPSGSAPYAACDVMILSSTTTDLEGNSSGPSVTTSYTYDDYNPNTGGGLQAGYHNLTQEQISTSNSNAPTVTHKLNYTINDQGLNGWTYYVVNKATHSETDDAGGHIYQCQDISYDDGGPSTLIVPVAGWPTTVSTYSNANCVTPRGAAISTSYTGYDAYGNSVATVDGVATTSGNSSLYNTNGCTLATNPYVMSHNWTVSESHYTACVTYDTPYNAQPVTIANAFGQSNATTFDYTQAALPTLLVDANSQQISTSYSIDSNGNETVQTQLPLHSGTYPTQSKTNSGCVVGSTLPCYERDTISNQYNTVTARTFYDSLGRAVETRTPGPTNGYDMVVFTTYNDAQSSTFQSLPFVVTSGSGWIDPNVAKDYTNNTPGGTGTYFDALGRVLAIKDPNFGQTQLPDQEPGLVCPAPLSNFYTDCTNYSLGTVSGDNNTYSVATSIDPNGHATVSYLDPLGRTTYVQLDSGKFGGTFIGNELKTIAYNILNEPTSVLVTDKATQSGQSITSATATASYDDLGQQTGLNDPDRGNHTYSYDADGHLLTDVSGTRTIGYVYDLLGRVGCVQNMTPTESATGACTSGGLQYVKNIYDTTQLGTQGSTDFPVGRLTKSVATTRYTDGTNAQVSELYQHDKRGRLIDEQISFPNLPGAWNVTTQLPSYKMQYSYNDANQVTTTTTSTNPAGQGYTTTRVYDPTVGGLTGLSDTNSGPADLATLSFNPQAQVSSINYLTSTSSALAVDQFGYDSNLRPITDTANWQSGSGNGTAAIFSQSRSFDPGSNLTSLTTTHAAVPGSSGSGGTETSNFCYDEQNRLVWAGNSGSQPLPGNGTCGSGTLASGLSGASYSDSYLYTHLGQLYQGPLNGGSAQEQYLYCNTSIPHQLFGLYPISSGGATCANYTTKTADYSSSYDTFGNVTSRSFSSTTGTLTYDLLDHLIKWFVSSTNQEQYVYDASGNRILRRSTTSSATTMTVYAFGLEEHVYSGSGTNQGNTYYYSLAGRLLGAKDANGTVFYMTDGLGSVLASFTNTASGAVLKGNQVFGAYGNARYYDPVAGVFLSVDPVGGNGSGNNPYAYVNGNPETDGDPTGLRPTAPLEPPLPPPALWPILGPWIGVAVLAVTSWWIWFGPEPRPRPKDTNTPQPQPVPTPTTNTSSGGIVVSVAPQPQPTTQTGGSGGRGGVPPVTIATPAPCSFSFDTRVTTDHGKKAIGTLHVGDKVLAYNPKTRKIEQEPILHVWVHTDNDLVDLTLTPTSTAQHGKPVTKTSEVIHTNQKYPFFTKEKGFLPVGQIKLGMHILRADGTYGVITGWKIVPGTSVMYNLEVAQDHTFMVGTDQWIVHNCTGGLPHQPDEVPARVRDLASMTDTARIASETQRMAGGQSTPNFAGVQVEILDSSFDFSRVFESAGPGNHAEELSVGWANDVLNLNWLSGLSDATQFRVTLVTQYFPCPESCAVAIDTGSWSNSLQEAADGRLQNLEFWHYMDNGLFRRIFPSP